MEELRIGNYVFNAEDEPYFFKVEESKIDSLIIIFLFLEAYLRTLRVLNIVVRSALCF